MASTTAQIDRDYYVDGIINGDVEFTTECPQWCQYRERLSHRLVEPDSDVRMHSRDFGEFVSVCTLESIKQQGTFHDWELFICDADHGMPASKGRQISSEVATAAAWMEAQH